MKKVDSPDETQEHWLIGKKNADSLEKKEKGTLIYTDVTDDTDLFNSCNSFQFVIFIDQCHP